MDEIAAASVRDKLEHGKLGIRRVRTALLRVVASVVFFGAGVAGLAAATQAGSTNATDLAAQEKEQCIRNLKVIYQAIQAYQTRNQDLPNWLSDLVPQFIEDANVLVCPVCRRTGKIEEELLADPNLPSSYLFEFCPVPLGDRAPKAPQRTRREWKRRQMGLLGSVVPIVRCRNHSPVLNVAFDGNIYESPPAWEQAFTNRASLQALSAASLFANEESKETKPAPAAKPSPPAPAKPAYAPRDEKAKPWQVDLTRFYNGYLTAPLHRQTNNTLKELPRGLQEFGGVEFDVRGVVQLASKTLTNRYPPQVRDIPVKLKAKQLHFLHAAAIGGTRDEGRQIGSYSVKYAGNAARLEIPIVYGKDVRDWHDWGNEGSGKGPTVVWRGTNVLSNTDRRPIRLFKTTWNNLLPDAEIESIDFVSSMEGPAPFLIAISASE